MDAATKHTPGPWWVIEKENGTLGIGAKEPDGEECRPAQINGTAVEKPWASVTWANARLIAAAPELLEDLERAVEHCPCSVNERESGHRVDCYAPSAIAVIAKARGQKGGEHA